MTISKNWRFNLVFIVVLVLSSIVLCRLFYLQISSGGYYKAMAQGQQVELSEVEGERGLVYFSNGEMLAINIKVPYLFISPAEIEEKELTAEKLASISSKDKEYILSLMEDSNSFYKIVEKELTKEKSEEIKDLSLKGVYIGNETKRYYPNENTASQIIGFVNNDGIGQYGVESYYNDQLKGDEVLEIKEDNPYQFFFNLSSDSIDGDSLSLTIDYNIQFMAKKILNEGVEKYDAEGGNIIVMNPNTGEIVAMAQSPNFDPNNYGNEETSSFKNLSTQEIFEPGSIFKPITMSMALNEGAVTPETMHNDTLGYTQFGTFKVSNYLNKIWGEINMTQVLEGSVNTGMMFAEKELGHTKFYEYLEKFGIFKKTGIDLAGETYSNNTEIKTALKNNTDVSFATASFGQGIAMTPLQMTSAFSVTINGGTLYKPHIVKKIGNEEIEPTIIKDDIISDKTTTEIRQMLISVVENGFGHLAKIDGYWIGGKTGTSQVPYSSLGINKTGYSDHTWQTFMGFAPALNPQFIVLVKLNNATKIKTSEYSAVPMFNELAKYIIDYWQIAPDYEEDLDK